MLTSEFKFSNTSLVFKIKSFVTLLVNHLYGAKVLRSNKILKLEE